VRDADRSTRPNKSSTIASRPEKFVGGCGRGGDGERGPGLRALGMSGGVVDVISPYLDGSTGYTGVV